MMKFCSGEIRNYMTMRIIPVRIIPQCEADIEKAVYGDAIYGRFNEEDLQWFGYNPSTEEFLFQGTETRNGEPMDYITSVVSKNKTFNNGIILNNCLFHFYPFANVRASHYVELLNRNGLWVEPREDSRDLLRKLTQNIISLSQEAAN